MGIAQWLKKSIFSSSRSQTFFSTLGGYSGINLPDTKDGYRMAYEKNVWVRRCVDCIGKNAATVPIKLRKKGTTPNVAQEELSVHPALDLLRNVNDQCMNRFDLIHSAAIDAFVYGELFWYVDRNKVPINSRRGRPTRLLKLSDRIPLQLYRLDPRYVTPNASGMSGRFIDNYSYYTNNSVTPRRIFQTDEIIAYRVFNLDDPYRGLSVVKTAMPYVRADLSAIAWNATFFDNASDPGNILSFKDPLDEKTLRSIEKTFSNKLQGIAKSHQFIALGGGPQFIDKGVSPKEADFSGSSMNNRDAICAVCGVPVFMVSGNDSSRYDTADPQKASFWEETEIPFLCWLAEGLNFGLKPMYEDLEDYEFFFDISEVPALKAVTLSRFQRINVATGVPFVTPNEGRAFVNLPAQEGGEKVLIPAGMVPIDSADLVLQATMKYQKHESNADARESGKEDLTKKDNTNEKNSDSSSNS